MAGRGGPLGRFVARPKARPFLAARRDDRAEVGVGTLIVFIAMVLVAALAAGVLIGTSGTLQERAMSTGKEATAEVSSNLALEAIYGLRSQAGGTLSDNIDNVTFHLTLAAGAVPVDLSSVIVRYSDGTNVRELVYGDTATYADATTEFALTIVRDADSSFSATSPTINSGDIVKITVFDVDLDNNENIAVHIIPEFGSSIRADFRTPGSFANVVDISLR